MTASVCVCVLEWLEYNCDPFSMSVSGKQLNGREQGSSVISFCSSTPLSIHLHKHTHENTQIFPQLQRSMEQSVFQRLYSRGKLIDLNCITGRRKGPKGASKPGEGEPEMEFWFKWKENNPSLTFWRCSQSLCFTLWLWCNHNCLFFPQKLHIYNRVAGQITPSRNG